MRARQRHRNSGKRHLGVKPFVYHSLPQIRCRIVAYLSCVLGAGWGPRGRRRGVERSRRGRRSRRRREVSGRRRRQLREGLSKTRVRDFSFELGQRRRYLRQELSGVRVAAARVRRRRRRRRRGVHRGHRLGRGLLLLGEAALLRRRRLVRESHLLQLSGRAMVR